MSQQIRSRQVALSSPVGFLAFGFGSGLSPWAPGTAGTVVAVPLALALKLLPLWAYGISLLVLFGFGVWICERASRALDQEDPGGIVWDEMVGYWLAVALVPATGYWLLAGFVLFRIFDILKPWPIRYLERRFKGGLGIMLDDVAAAAYAVILLELARRILEFTG